jgi:hypothetical protein
MNLKKERAVEFLKKWNSEHPRFRHSGDLTTNPREDGLVVDGHLRQV